MVAHIGCGGIGHVCLRGRFFKTGDPRAQPVKAASKGGKGKVGIEFSELGGKVEMSRVKQSFVCAVCRLTTGRAPPSC